MFRTDIQSTIIATSDGQNVTFNVEPTDSESKEASDSSGLIISLVDLHDELVIIKNTGKTAMDISGWRLLSVKGNQDFYFPSRTVLEPGNIIKVDTGPGTKDGPGVLKWTGRYIWNNDGDPAELYSETGMLISSYGY